MIHGFPIRRLFVTAVLSATAIGAIPGNASAADGESALRAVPVLPTFSKAGTNQFERDLAKADAAGMRPGVFAKIGDSNIASYNALYGLGCNQPIFNKFRGVKPTLDKYRVARAPIGFPVPFGIPSAPACAPANSFSRFSAATRSGFCTRCVLTNRSDLEGGGFALWAPDPKCRAHETLVGCEIRQLEPRFSFISTGTNDELWLFPLGEAAVERFGEIVAEVRRNRSVPILSTVPPHLDVEAGTAHWQYVVGLNQAIVRAARIHRVPLLNLWRPLAGGRMVNFGMEATEGLHLETLGGYDQPDALRQSVNFRPGALAYGTNRRNLLFLRTLKRLDREVRELRQDNSPGGRK